MSPVFILSRLCLKRRFQFFGISVPPEVRYLTTFLTASSSITFRRPTRSALSAGTFTVMSLCRILIVRYSRFSPSTSRFSRLTTVPAPWWGYTTLSPTLYKLRLLFPVSRESAGGPEGSTGEKTRVADLRKNRYFCRDFLESPCSGRLLAQRGGEGGPECLRLDAGSIRADRRKDGRDAELPAFLEPAVGLGGRAQPARQAHLAECGKPLAHRQALRRR